MTQLQHALVGVSAFAMTANPVLGGASELAVSQPSTFWDHAPTRLSVSQPSFPTRHFLVSDHADYIGSVASRSLASDGDRTGVAKSISDINGDAFVSPHQDKKVQKIKGVVTGLDATRKFKGFYIQEITSGKPEPQSGMYVFTYKDAPRVQVGDEVEVDGQIVTYQPDPRELSKTQISFAEYRSVGRTDLPEAIVIGENGLMPPKDIYASQAPGGDVENPSAPFRPDQDALAFYKSLQNMRVTVQNPLVIGVSKRGMIAVALDGGKHLRSRTESGLALLPEDGVNTDVVTLDLRNSPQVFESLNVQPGDRIVGDVTGIMDYAFGQFRVRVTDPIEIERGNLQRRTETTLVGDDEHFTVANFNVENLYPASRERILELAKIIVNNLKSPDVIAMQEVQDHNGPDSGGGTSGEETLKAISDAIYELTGVRYYLGVEIAPQNGQDGGQPGGNIRVAYLYRPDRIQLKIHGDAKFNDKAQLEFKNGELQLNKNPVRIDPRNPAYDHSRKPLAIEYKFNGQKVIQVNLHSSSKRGDDSLWGRYQPAGLDSTRKRVEQHKAVEAFIQGALTLNQEANLIVGGDLNSYAWEESVKVFTDAGLVHLAQEKGAPGDLYSYFYDGIGHYHLFDYILASSNLAKNAEVEIIHLNSGFKDQFSDHDLVVTRFYVPKTN